MLSERSFLLFVVASWQISDTGILEQLESLLSSNHTAKEEQRHIDMSFESNQNIRYETRLQPLLSECPNRHESSVITLPANSRTKVAALLIITSAMARMIIRCINIMYYAL